MNGFLDQFLNLILCVRFVHPGQGQSRRCLRQITLVSFQPQISACVNKTGVLLCTRCVACDLPCMEQNLSYVRGMASSLGKRAMMKPLPGDN